MACELLGRQSRILRGPMWSGCESQLVNKPLAARVNVACVSNRLVNKRLASSEQFSTEPILQPSAVSTLKHNAGCVWLKIDACDVKAALQESQRGEWNGDEDLGDGKVENKNAEYNIYKK